MSIRDWALDMLKKDSFVANPISDHGVCVTRNGRSSAIAFCAPSSNTPFTLEDLGHALAELPEAGMIVITRRTVDPTVFRCAKELHVSIDTFGAFRRALEDCDDIALYEHPEVQYFERRVYATQAVSSLVRLGHRAWEIGRLNPLRSLTIATHEAYELTNAGLADVLSQYPTLKLDAVVATNPNTQGFGGLVSASAGNAEVKICTMNDFLSAVRTPWK